MKKFFLFVLLAAVAVAGVSAHNAALEVEQITACSPELPQAFEGLRVALLSDVHGRQLGQDNEKLLTAVRAARPDLIALCGDLLDSAEELPAMTALAAQLLEIAPVYYVTGNHEWGARCVNDTVQALTEVGVCCLDDSYVFLERDGACIALAGVRDPNGQTDPQARQKLVEAIRAEEPEAYILMLSHRNDAPEDWARLGVQTVLSGHGHGGVVRLPFVGGLFGAGGALFPAYTSGAYSAQGCTVVVSRGLGGVRVFCRPHLPVVQLSGETNGGTKET